MKKIGKLQIITDISLQSRYSHIDLTEMAIAGGADTIQFRSKSGSTRELIETAEAMKKICKRAGVPLIINDRVDVAMAVNADGVHLGQNDFPISTARKILGHHRIIGGSAGNMDEAEICLKDGADYIGSGPVYYTGSKKDAGPAIGVDSIKRLVEGIPLPLIAIGGIAAVNVPELLKAGVHGVAVISAVCMSEDPAGATEEFIKRLDFKRN
ncbi:thiamine phosphate synthase [Thermodesulfobacteriota bacterium]